MDVNVFGVIEGTKRTMPNYHEHRRSFSMLSISEVNFPSTISEATTHNNQDNFEHCTVEGENTHKNLIQLN
jgi:hypothetical protein